jgi:hypothetical protein
MTDYHIPVTANTAAPVAVTDSHLPSPVSDPASQATPKCSCGHTRLAHAPDPHSHCLPLYCDCRSYDPPSLPRGRSVLAELQSDPPSQAKPAELPGFEAKDMYGNCRNCPSHATAHVDGNCPL